MVIASRVLTLRRQNGATEIPIRIHAPECEKPGIWACRYVAGWPEGKRIADAYGADGIQALLIALQMIGAELYTSTYHPSGALVWDKLG